MNKLTILMNASFVGALIVAIYLALIDPPAKTINIVSIAVAMFGLFVGNWLVIRQRGPRQ